MSAHRWQLGIGGGPEARAIAENGRVYRHKRSARRAMWRVLALRLPGLQTIWIIPHYPEDGRP